MVGATGCVVVVTVVRRRLDATQQPMTMQVMMGIITKSTKDASDAPTAVPTALPGEDIKNTANEFQVCCRLCAEAITGGSLPVTL